MPVVREALLSDKRLGANPIMRQLYELDLDDDDAEMDVPAHSCPRLWCYRSQVTVDHLQNAINDFANRRRRNVCVILQEFLQKEDRLRWVRLLPDIIRLQKILNTHLSRRLDNSQARDSPIKDVIRDTLKGEVQEEAKRLLKTYFTAWKAIRPYLSSYGPLRIPESMHSLDLNGNTEACYFLPTLSGNGLCALVMAHFLATTHNEFMENCKPALGLKFEQSKVSISDVTQAHLVAYDHERDFLPMVYAHCDYSLEIGRGTEVTYNLPGLERQLIETFVRGKPYIDIKIQPFTYREDVKSFEKHTLLKGKVPQMAIPSADQRQMVSELHELSEVCDALRAIEIAMGFLISTGADPNKFYKEYLGEVLCMNPVQYLASGKMQSTCRLTHILSMWLMLTVERACRLFSVGQEPFEIESCFLAEFEEEQTEALKHELRHIDIDHLLADLTEYITLELPMRKESEKDFSICDCLQIYNDKKGTSEAKGIEKLPEDIGLRYIIHLWKIVAKVSEKHRVNERIIY